MKSVEFSTTTTLPAPPDEVFDHLADPDNHVGLSPLVVEVRDIRREPDAVRFTAVERFALGPLHHDNVIEVTLNLGDGTISGDVVSPGGVRVAYAYRVEPVPGGTRVTDHYRLSAPFGLLRFAVGQAKKVQEARGRELVRRFEAKRSPRS
ncbi:SRPBCC family protein [Umezawaea tangerina]|uniref:Polyketide cyclase/dehydrase/lipid transport protein n=1 Tax=Umezawaea tangerina TaxID=84725 RepID=A0A2T0T2D2_9PSEU|nr:SRPBCC family protein [Umezawaea tangerina]PRY39838.1 polyketide cyclase/dehydrase/lipid transport protein [Umezawaea tangerina]